MSSFIDPNRLTDEQRDKRLIALLHSPTDQLLDVVMPGRKKMAVSLSAPAFRLREVPTPGHVKTAMRSVQKSEARPSWRAATSSCWIDTSSKSHVPMVYERPPVPSNHRAPPPPKHRALHAPTPPQWRAPPSPAATATGLVSATTALVHPLDNPAVPEHEPVWQAPISTWALVSSGVPHRRPPVCPSSHRPPPQRSASPRARKQPNFVSRNEPRGVAIAWRGRRLPGPNDRHYGRGVQKRLDEIQGTRSVLRERLSMMPGFANLDAESQGLLVELTTLTNPSKYNRGNSKALNGQTLGEFIARLDLAEDSPVRTEMAVVKRQSEIRELVARLRKGVGRR